MIPAERLSVPDLVAEVERLRRIERALRDELVARFDRSAAKGKGRALGLKEASALVRGLAEDARDDGNGSDDDLSTALDDAADAIDGVLTRGGA